MKFNLPRFVKTLFNSEDGKYSLFNSMGRATFGSGKNKAELLGYNDISLYVNRALAKRADKVSEIQFVLKDSNGKIIENNPLLDILNKPNDKMTGMQFWKLWQKFYDVTGEAFIRLTLPKNTIFNAKKVTGMEILPSQNVTVNYNENKTEVTSYTYTNPSGGSEVLTTDEVLRVYEPDPLNINEPLSVMRAGIRTINTGLQLEEYQASILKNGGKPDGVFTFKSVLKSEQIKQMKDKFVEDNAGSKNAGVPMFLGGEADFKRLSLNPEELSYLESRKVTLNDICIMTGVPKELLASVGETTFANADTALTIFMRETVVPCLRNLCTNLDLRLFPDNLELSFIDPTPENIDNTIKLVKAGFETDSMTTNEKREMLKLEPRKEKEADEILVGFSKVPLTSVNDSSQTASMKKKIANGDFVHPLSDPDTRDIYRKIADKRLSRREKDMLSVMRTYFAEQEKRIISKLEATKTFKRKGIIDQFLDKNFEIATAKISVLPLLKSIMIASGQEATDLLDYSFGFNLNSSIESWLDNRVGIFANEINNTTFDRLTSAFEDSFNAGENRTQLIDRIKGVYTGFDENRAKTIARTEVHGATQKATIEGYRQAGSPIKIWVSVTDSVTRDSHLRLDGEERPIDAPFSNGLQFAGDPSGDASESVNCRCSS